MKICSHTKRMIISIFCIVIGIVLNVLSFMKVLDDFWSGFGVGFIVVGVVQLIRHIRYRTNEEYREQVDIKIDDERNKFLSTKAWAWTGYTFIIICAIATIGFRIAGYSEYSSMTCMVMCLMLIIYYVSYMILKRKY